MGIATFFREFTVTVYEQIFLGRALPNPANERLILLRAGLSITAASTKADLIAGEVAQTFGYSRAVVGRPITSVDAGTDVVTMPEHNLSAGDSGFLVLADGATAIPPLAIGVKYWVINPTSNTVQLSTTQGGSAINITGTSTNNIFKIAPVFDVADNRAETFWEPATFTATGGTISYQGYFVLRGSSATANVAISTTNITTDEITTATAHNLATADEVLITPDAGGVNPAPVIATTIYFARVISTTVISLHPTAVDANANTNRLNITSVHTGTVRVRHARGEVTGFEYLPVAQNILDTQSQVIRVFKNVLNAGALTGV